MIDRLTIDRIKDAADIYDVVSEFVSLKRVGQNYRGLCPFHNDRTPSFYVTPSRGICHCFTCGEGGDAVSFLMKHEQYSYPDALRWLARRYSITIEEEQRTDEQRREESERESMFIANEWAAKYFKDILHYDIDGRAVGMQYFRQRGIRDDIIEKFRLGFSLSDQRAFARKAKEEGHTAEYFIKTGICYQRDNGDVIDRFAGRAIFPWIGVSGKVVAFGGRVLDSRTKGVDQKYVNSPDSPIYHKDHELYGIFQAKKAIAKENCVYMVEGYTDVISMHQCGLENVVANSGTALSKHQIRLLHRFTQNIVLLYDGDAAGIKAALRGTDMLLQDAMNVKVLLLPDGDDPDSFARKHTATEFKEYIEQHQTDFIEFKTRVLLQGETDPHKRSEAISSIIKSVSMIPDQITRATYIKDCSTRLGINEQTLFSTMNQMIRSYREEQRREEEREQRRQQQQSVAQQPSNGQLTAPQQLSNGQLTAPQQLSSGQLTAPQQLPSGQLTAPQQLPSGQQPATQQLPSGQQPATQQLPSGQQPATQQLPSDQQPATQQLPSGQQPATQQLPSDQQPATHQLPCGQRQVAGQSSAATGDPYDDIPPEAFLPPEAFSRPTQQAPTTQQQASTQPLQGYTQPLQGYTQPQQTSPTPSQQGTTTAQRVQRIDNDVQSLLMKAVVRYGERILYDNLEDEEGNPTSLTVAQYIEYDLGEDNLQFKNPLYNQMLAEASLHSSEEGFKAETYFIKHPDYEVSRVAYLLSIDNVQLTKRMQKEMTQELLVEHIKHLILDFRKEYVDEKLASLRSDIGLAASDHDRMMQLMAEYQNFQKIRNALAKQLGTSVLSLSPRPPQ